MSKNVSNEFKNIIKSGGPFYPYIEMTLSDGTELTLTAADDFLIDGDTYYSEGSESGFPLGVAISKSITLTIAAKPIPKEAILQDSVNNNILDTASNGIICTFESNDYDCYYARITLYTEANLSSGSVERIQEGIFTVIDSVKPGNTLEIIAYDDMYKSDVTFTSSLMYPVSAQMLLNEVCDFCDITLGSATFPNNDFQVQQAPEGLTGRQVIGYIAQIAGGNAIIDRTGRLVIKTYDMSDFDIQETVSAGEIETASGIHIISEYTEYPDIGTDSVAITGVSVTISAEDSDSEDEVYVTGTEDYAININNPLIAGQEKAAADLIASAVVGVYARPFAGSFFPDPTIEFMDLAYLVDTKDNVYKTYITRHDFTYLGKSTIENGMESPEKHGGSYYSNASEVYQKAKEEIKKNKTQWEQAMEHLTEQVANASGLYTTEEVQDDGSIIYYMHNKPALKESDMVWKMTAETITVSTDGGKTWNAGITINGDVIAKIMSTIGINFDWGVGGILVIKDAYGNQTAYINAKTGEVRFSVSSLKISGKPIEDYIKDELSVSELLSQKSVFNALTNNGLSQGIFLENGQLYLNGEYMEFDGATIGGWLVSGNQLRNNQTNFEVKIQAPTVYGTSGLSTADIIAVHDKAKDTWPFVVTSDGSMDLGEEFQYRPNGFTYDSTVQLNVGGWQIKKSQNVWGYDEVIYWDTIETQTNGIGAKGPWVVWGGWNGGASLDYVNNYKFVVSDVGDVYAQRFFDNGQQLLPIVVEVMHKTLTNDFCYVSKSGYYLLACYLIRSVDHNIYVKAIQYRNDNTYTVALQGANGGEIDLYTMWAKMPD